jgi:predicted outer membrane repeat protein
MGTDGELAVHDKVVFKANTAAGADGGAVSSP